MISTVVRLLLFMRIRFLEVMGPATDGSMLLWAALIGFVGGISSAAFREANIELKLLLTGQSRDIVAIAESLSLEMRLIIPTLGGFCAGLALLIGTRLFRGMRSQDYLEVIRLGDGVISIRPTIARLTSSLLSISSGASIGREGGMVQLSALFASSIGRFFRLSQPKLRLLVACGGAAGLASAYNTPLAGALFIAEIVLQSLAIEALGPLIIASVVATITIRHWIGMSPIFTLPEFRAPVVVEFLPLIGLGILAGVASPVFLTMLDFTKKIFKLLNLPLPFSLALGGLLVGVISLDVPEVWGNGHAVIEGLLNKHSEQDFVFAILFLKVLATLAVVGSGAVGGVFTPSLVVGATIGWLYSHQLSLIFPGIGVDTVTYTVLGMSAFLAGTTHAPLMAILMVFEMTLDGNLLFPLIVVAMSARYLSAMIRPTSVYGQTLENTSMRLHYLMQVSDIQSPVSMVVNMDASAEAVSQMFCMSTVQLIWVVDDLGCYQGAISLHDMKQFLGEPSLKDLSAAHVFMENNVPTISDKAALTDAYSAFALTDADKLPVINKDRMLIGEITKNDVLLSIN
jgi:CIC family chloride channel protein